MQYTPIYTCVARMMFFRQFLCSIVVLTHTPRIPKPEVNGSNIYERERERERGINVSLERRFSNSGS